jgi:hypothetical protein
MQDCLRDICRVQHFVSGFPSCIDSTTIPVSTIRLIHANADHTPFHLFDVTDLAKSFDTSEAILRLLSTRQHKCRASQLSEWLNGSLNDVWISVKTHKRRVNFPTLLELSSRDRVYVDTKGLLNLATTTRLRVPDAYRARVCELAMHIQLQAEREGRKDQAIT